jgi:hypothetical protein
VLDASHVRMKHITDLDDVLDIDEIDQELLPVEGSPKRITFFDQTGRVPRDLQPIGLYDGDNQDEGFQRM